MSGASACSVSFTDASVSLPDSATVFSSVERARLACRSNASFSDFTEDSALNVDIVSSNEACALAAICLPMSCTPAAQIWPHFTIASRLPWLNAISSSAVFIAFSMPSFTFACVSANPAAARAMPSFSPDTVDSKPLRGCIRRLVFQRGERFDRSLACSLMHIDLLVERHASLRRQRPAAGLPNRFAAMQHEPGYRPQPAVDQAIFVQCTKILGIVLPASCGRPPARKEPL